MEEQFEKYNLESCYRNMPALLPLNRAKDIARNRNNLTDQYKKCEENKLKVNNLIPSVLSFIRLIFNHALIIDI